jgi:hypothetical protein
MKKGIIPAILIMLGAISQPAFTQKVKYHWDNDQNSVTLLKSLAGKPDLTVWRFNYGPVQKPFFHPVYSPDGTLLSADAPPDHPWHLGQWFCWKYINKLNYWEYAGDPQKAESEGRTDVLSNQITAKRNGQAKIVMKIAYHPWAEPDSVVMTETRTILVTAPARDGSYSMYYDLAFQALTDVVLDRTPVQTNAAGVTWGGYAGLSMRFDQRLKEPVYFSEKRDSVINGEGNGWVAANLKTEAGKTVQLIMFDHPGNPRYPSPWYTINRPKEKFWFFSPALLYQSALELKAGAKMHLRYRVLIPAKPLTKEDILRTAGSSRRIS